MRLFGRAEETHALRRLLDAAVQGESGVRVVRGEPGIGKTALLDDAAAAACRLGFDLLSVVGIESEQELGYAALHRLLGGSLDERADLPEPQRDALGVAFGLVAGPPANPFRVALAVLTLLARRAARRPVLCVCDDAQWVDRESLQVLAFTARRLDADPVVLLFGVRDPEEGDPDPARALTDLPALPLRGLATDVARTLAVEAAHGRVDERELDRLLVESGGNPLALRELATDPDRGLPGRSTVPLADRLPLGRRLEDRFGARVRALPDAVRTLLLVVAEEPTGDAELVWRAVVGLAVTDGASGLAAAAEPAVAAGLLVLHPTVSFRHPLQRSAVRRGAEADALRRVHAALAAALPDGVDPDRRAWHLAAATTGPDERIARELETAALRARDRAGFSAEAAFLAAAADRTGSPALRAARLLPAGIAAIRAGLPERAHDLLEAIPAQVDPALRAATDLTRGAALIQLDRLEQGLPLMSRAATAFAAAWPPGPAREALLETVQNAAMTAWIDVAEIGRMLDATAATITDPGPDPAFADIALDGCRDYLRDGDGDGGEGLAGLQRIAAALATGLTHDVALRWGPLIVAATRELFDDRAVADLTARLLGLARDNGTATGLNTAFVARGNTETLRGRLDAAQLLYDEAAQVAAARGAPYIRRSYDVLLRAWRGDAAGVAAGAAGLPAAPAGYIGGTQVQAARTARAVLALARGDYPEAVAAAAPVLADDPPFWGHLALPDLVEAGARGGDRAVAEAALARFERRATRVGTPWALGLLARCRAMLTRGAAAEALLRESVDRLARTDLRTEQARAHLVLGEWLRRRRRRTDARHELERAHGMFVAMGAGGFAGRARAELAAAGAAVPGSGGTARVLTAHETRIARLAADGATNQQIATQLYVSASTVEYHLRKVFQKTGVRSRRELATVELDDLADG